MPRLLDFGLVLIVSCAAASTDREGSATRADSCVCAAVPACAVATVDDLPSRGHQQDGDPAGPTPPPGKPSPDFVAARRLYEHEQWSAAAASLARVARGEAGDDLGNREVAELNEAKVLFLLHRDAEAAAIFRAIAHHPSHNKHRESFLWLVKLLDRGSPYVCPSDVLVYETENEGISDFANSEQQDLKWRLDLTVGKYLLCSGERPEAVRHLERVPVGSPYYGSAQSCLARAKSVR
jgi:hypothetical protein